MFYDMIIKNKDIQINIDELEITIQANSGGTIEGVTVDGHSPSDIEEIVIQDSSREIQEHVSWELHQHNKFKDNPAWREAY